MIADLLHDVIDMASNLSICFVGELKRRKVNKHELKKVPAKSTSSRRQFHRLLWIFKIDVSKTRCQLLMGLEIELFVRRFQRRQLASNYHVVVFAATRSFVSARQTIC